MDVEFVLAVDALVWSLRGAGEGVVVVGKFGVDFNIIAEVKEMEINANGVVDFAEWRVEWEVSEVIKEELGVPGGVDKGVIE